MKLAEVKTIYESNARQVAATMRKNADAIERGEHGDVQAVVSVMLVSKNGSDAIEVFGLGETTYWNSLGVLQAGISKLTRMIQE